MQLPADQPEVVLHGGVPPPVGGVTLHVLHLLQRLTEVGKGCVVVDRTGGTSAADALGHVLKGRQGLLRSLRFRQSVHHIHVSAPGTVQLFQLRALMAVLPRRGVAITFHSGRFPTEYRSRMRRFMVRSIARRSALWFALNDESFKYVDGLESECRVLRTGSYVRGSSDAGSHASVTAEIEALRTRVTHLVVSSGYREPNSGFLELAQVVADLGDQWGLVVVGYGTIDAAHMEELRSQLSTMHGIVEGPLTPEAFAQVLSCADVYARNFEHDSYGMAIAEALELGTPAVATLVCDRPVGCMTYLRGDRVELKEALAGAIACGRVARPDNDAFADYLSAYRDLLTH